MPESVTEACIRLLAAAREWGAAKGFTATWIEESPEFEPIREIGRSVYREGGLDGLMRIIQTVRHSYRYGYLLDHFWDGIGEWRP
jgi:hypothetical protein